MLIRTSDSAVSAHEALPVPGTRGTIVRDAANMIMGRSLGLLFIGFMKQVPACMVTDRPKELMAPDAVHGPREFRSAGRSHGIGQRLVGQCGVKIKEKEHMTTDTRAQLWRHVTIMCVTHG